MTIRAIADLVGGAVEGGQQAVISGIASIETAGPAEITFADRRHAAALASSKAGAAIVGDAPASAPMPLIRVGDVQSAVAKLLWHWAPAEDLPPAGIHATAVVASDAVIGEGVAIGPHVVIGRRARIGANSVLCANVSVNADAVVGDNSILFEGVVVRHACVVGNRVRIGPNSVIGWDGFGYYFQDGRHEKIPHIGNVVIGDDVEIGACSCVDRAKFGSTTVGEGTKIDNLVQVAHNVQIGRGCVLVAQCGIAGSTKLGNYVVIGGNAGLHQNITLGDGVQCSAFAAVAQDVPAGETVIGVPARPAREALRIIQASTRLPELLKQVKALESRLSALESPKDH